MKFFFKKYLQFEQQHGTADGEERVKALAREWAVAVKALFQEVCCFIFLDVKTKRI